MPTDEPKRALAPATYVPEHVVAIVDGDAVASAVGRANPLPAMLLTTAASSTPLVGTASGATTAGPFAPQLGRAILLTLSGSWTGSAQLLRSTDGGATKLPITLGGDVWGSYTASCNEAVTNESEAAATYYLALAVTAGTLAYRIAQ